MDPCIDQMSAEPNSQYLEIEQEHHVIAVNTEQDSSRFIRPEDFGPHVHQEAESDHEGPPEDQPDPVNPTEMARLLNSPDVSKLRKLFETIDLKGKGVVSQSSRAAPAAHTPFQASSNKGKGVFPTI